MNKRIQRIVSIIIGLIIAALLIYIGWRIIQRRQSRATTPVELQCEIQGTNGTVTWRDANPEIEIISYGTVSSDSYPFLCEEENTPTSGEEGLYDHTCTIGPLVSGTNYAVSIGDVTAQCSASETTEEAVISIEPTSEPQPTEAPSPTPEQNVEVTPVQDTQLLPQEKVTAYFDENEDATIEGCVNEFASENYTGLGQMCSEEWARRNYEE